MRRGEGKHSKSEVIFRVAPGRDAEPVEIESLALLLFAWWKRAFEEEALPKQGTTKGKKA